MDYNVVKQLHTYYESVQSLEKTATYACETYDLKVNRHQLSRMFRNAGLYVKPPNGQPEKHWIDLSNYNSPTSHLCAAVIDSVVSDLRNPDCAFVDKITAYSFLGTQRFIQMLGTLGNVATGFELFQNIPGVDIQEAILYRSIYDEAYRYWVDGIGD